MTDDRIDFSSLDPARDNERLDGAVASIMERAEASLATRRSQATVVGQIFRWRRPMLAAAAALAVASIGVLTQVEAPEEQETRAEVAEAIGIPTSLAQWVRAGETPTTAEIFAAIAEEGL
jgi:predicted MFS family arabinose efflux permease